MVRSLFSPDGPTHEGHPFLHGHWRGALRLGFHHGAFSAASCWALMLIQFVLGVMNLTVMAIVGVIIALGKIASPGELVAPSHGLVSILGGIPECDFDFVLIHNSGLR